MAAKRAIVLMAAMTEPQRVRGVGSCLSGTLLRVGAIRNSRILQPGGPLP
jgi:hypothetical protein